MLGIFTTALAMSAIRLNVPMLFISIFSFYFAWMGRRYALNRKGTPSGADRWVTLAMTMVFAGMTLYGAYATFTVVLTPVIVIWSRKINAGVRPRGMP